MRKCVAGAVIFDGKVLIMQRVPSRKVLPEYWEIPGGGVENEESYESALVRELQEETGLIVDSIGEQYFWLEDDRHSEPHYLVFSDTDNIRLEPTEHQRYLWISTPEELNNLLITSEMKESVLLALKKATLEC